MILHHAQAVFSWKRSKIGISARSVKMKSNRVNYVSRSTYSHLLLYDHGL